MRSRIARFAMRRRATAVGALILVFVMAGTALAVAPGSNFKLGVINSISGYVTTLTGSNNGAMLHVKNTNTNSLAKGIQITVASGKAPIRVNSGAGKAIGLNADKVDGKNASAFLPAGGKALDAFHADAADTATNATNATNAMNATNAGNANLLDGLDSAAFRRAALPAGQTLTGMWGVSGDGSAAGGSYLTLVIDYASKPSSAVLAEYVSGASSTHCPGVGTANPGYLCLYQAWTFNTAFAGTLLSSTDGIVLYFLASHSQSNARGTWALAAPAAGAAAVPAPPAVSLDANLGGAR